MAATVYRYSKKQSIATILVMLILGGLFTSNIYRAWYGNDKFNLLLFGALVAFLAGMLVLVIAKRLIPALCGYNILELNDVEIIDYLRNITINWQDVESISTRRTRSALHVVVNLKWESNHGQAIPVSLGWVEGSDKEIYQDFQTYFDRFSSSQNS